MGWRLARLASLSHRDGSLFIDGSYIFGQLHIFGQLRRFRGKKFTLSLSSDCQYCELWAEVNKITTLLLGEMGPCYEIQEILKTNTVVCRFQKM